MCSNGNRVPVTGLTDLESSYISLATISVLKLLNRIFYKILAFLFLWTLFSLNKENEDNQTQSRNGDDTTLWNFTPVKEQLVKIFPFRADWACHLNVFQSSVTETLLA